MGIVTVLVLIAAIILIVIVLLEDPEKSARDAASTQNHYALKAMSYMRARK